MNMHEMLNMHEMPNMHEMLHHKLLGKIIKPYVTKVIYSHWLKGYLS